MVEASHAARAGTQTIVRRLGRVEYEPTWRAMQRFTDARDPSTPDEIWLLEHPPVFTLGLGADERHHIHDIGVPLIRIDRGGQITYHGPGQILAYLLLDLARRSIGVRELVRRMEQAVIELLAGYGIAAARRSGAPGVYVGQAKIAALGLRIRRGCCYHGLALNADMDLAPFAAIDPCGHPGLAVTSLAELGVRATPAEAGEALLRALQRTLDAEGYRERETHDS
ncbi:MAG: lipoyl(octanoyl) transferase LipB [Rhodocyclaceae bacterium]